ncbi:DNA-binding SARP family transcriptional activator [Haloactinopolyspora alba]|uniref:DNA-binding SARP family transcriptional activator n=1 Tax=Haloactinopolyspora alba TaxID=648780 RepID=A0A2P8D3A6_9ACTN|nr:AfsR/SARP family transcriptional regulator [Haloactinopolyspora alba]PSK91707.1 DNA-binding SARP family transcriptional activator [Haloactinopolyspora alba]
MRFEVLGPVRAVDGSGVVGPVSKLRRRLLAALLTRANRTVGTEVLAEVLWGDDLPERPGKSLQVHVHRLRRVLDRPDRLVGVPDGYLLEIGAGELDAAEFRTLHADARPAREADDLDTVTATLRTALALWRGAPYADVDDPVVVAADARRLAEARLIAGEELYEAELARGRAREIVPELTELAAEYPLRERLIGQLMLALYRSGRQARALTTYRAARRRLDRELGVEPGRELRELHDAMAAEDPGLLAGAAGEPEPDTATAAATEQVAPAQIPPVPGAFVGRDGELADLDDVTIRSDEAATVVVSGMAGVGKTGLALRFAHRAADRFGDGQLYVDLRGHATAPSLHPTEALGQLLRGLGSDPGQVADSTDAATARYRSLLAGRKILVVLDNAASAEQVRPLLAATPGCMTLITSRNRLPALVAGEGAHRIVIDTLTGAEARQLLSRLLGRARVDAEPAAAGALIDECAGLPLALRIAAAQLGDERHRPIDDYVRELRERGLSMFALDDDERSAVAAAFDLSYQRLAADTRRCFGLLGLVPGADVTVDAVAALTGAPPAQARAELRRLAGTHLVDEHAAGRYRLHDLLREYVRSVVDTEAPPADREAALGRLYTWYYQGKEAAWWSLRSHPRRPPRPGLSGGVPELAFGGESDAVAWLRAEFGNIAAAARAAAQRRSWEPWSWHLVLGTAIPLARRGFLADVLPLLRTAVDAARDAGDRHAIAHTLTEFGAVRSLAGSAVSDDLVTEVLEHAESVGDQPVQAYCLYLASVVKARANEYAAAATCLERSLALQREIGDHAGQALALNHLGVVAMHRGDLRGAVRRWEEILALDEGQTTRSALINVTLTRLKLGELDGLDDTLRRADRLVALHADPAAECVFMSARAEWHRTLGRVDDALDDLATAHHLAERLAIPRLQTDTRAETGFCHLMRGELDTAADEFERASGIAEAAGLHPEGSYALRGLAEARLAAGDHRAAASHARAAIDLAGDVHRVYRADALTSLAAAELAAGHTGEAARHGKEAVAIHRTTEHYLGLARALRVLGTALLTTAEPHERSRGVALLQDALHRFDTLRAPEAAAVRALLADQ